LHLLWASFHLIRNVLMQRPTKLCQRVAALSGSKQLKAVSSSPVR
jgi:hypothetical protein